MNSIYKISVSIVFLICFNKSIAQSPAWQWVKTAGNSDGTALSTDLNGDVYVAGYFSDSSVTFGNVTLHAGYGNGNGANSFVVKYSPTGNVLWAKLIGGEGWTYINDIDCDSSGNIYIAGQFMDDSLVLDNIVLASVGSMDVFIAKLDSFGNILWAKTASGNDMESGGNIDVNAQGVVVVAGSFYSSVLSIDNVTINHSPGWNEDFFIARIDINGNVGWVNSSGGSDYEYSGSVAFDRTGNILAIGDFESDSIQFGSTMLLNSHAFGMGRDAFVVKYDSIGNVIWAKSFGGNNEEYEESIAADPWGNVIIGGYYASDTINFGSFIFYNSNNPRLFLVKLNHAGNVLWAQEGTVGGTHLNDIQTDNAANIYITGQIWAGGLTFGSCIITLPSVSNYADMFVSKFDSTGSSIWCKGVFGSYGENSYGISVDLNSNIYIVGSLSSDTISFDNLLVNVSTGSFFVAKLFDLTAINENSDLTDLVSCFPNPFTESLIIESQTKGSALLFDMQGKKINEWKVNPGRNQIDVRSIDSGMYILQITSEGLTVNKKIIKTN
jgi:hypothetical protein